MTPEPTPFAERELAAIDDVLAGREVEPDLADIAELTRALRAERPDPSPYFARSLDEWAEGGFSGKAPRAVRLAPPKPRRRWLRPPSLALAGALATVAIGITVIPPVLSGGGGGGDMATSAVERSGAPAGDSSAGGSGGGAPETPIPDVDTAARSAEPAPSQADDSSALQRSTKPAAEGEEPTLPTPPSGTAPKPRGRSVEHSAAIELAALPERLEEVAAGVSRVTDAAGGFVARSSVDANPTGGSARFELRIPSQRLTATLADLSELANVRSRTQSSLDITRTVRSAEERLEEGRAERSGLLKRLEDNPTNALRARLRRVNANIADAKGDLASANRRASLSKVAVTVTGDPAATGATVDDGRWTPADAVRDAVRMLEVVAGAALIALAVALPLALLAVPLALMGRRRVRRGRERALDAV